MSVTDTLCCHSVSSRILYISFCFFIHFSYSAVASSAAGTLYGVEYPADPVLQQVGDVADRVAVGEEVPAAGTVAVVVEP